MTDAAVFKGTIGALRTIGGRKVIAVTVEVPIEHQSVVAKIAEHGAWVAVARLHDGEQPKQEEKKPRKWHELSVGEQAGIRCNEKAFWDYLEFRSNLELGPVKDADRASEILRNLFCVESRRDIPREKWGAFDADYLYWLRT